MSYPEKTDTLGSLSLLKSPFQLLCYNELEWGVLCLADNMPTVEDSHLSTWNWREPYTCIITGLKIGTKYHVRAYALSGLEYYGDDKVFTTEDNGGGDGSSVGYMGVYWSSSLKTKRPYTAHGIGFAPEGYNMNDPFRDDGISVRAVLSARQD